MLGCVVGAGLIAKFLTWLARMLRELSRLGSKKMPVIEAEEEEESRPSAVHVQPPFQPMLQPYLTYAATLSDLCCNPI